MSSPSQSLSLSRNGGDDSNEEEEEQGCDGDDGSDEEEGNEDEEGVEEEEKSGDEGLEYNPRIAVSPMSGLPTHRKKWNEDHFKDFHDAYELK